MTKAENTASHADEQDQQTLDPPTGEQTYISAWRAARYGSGTDETAGNLAGLALSGGGIRSATFSLGIMQALAHRGLLKRFDYLSTVSGGGYIGSAITWLVSDLAGDSYSGRCSEKQTGKGPKFGLNRDDFPFGCDDPAPEAPSSDDGDQKKMLSYLRQHGNYLAPGAGISLFSLVGVILRGMLLNLLVWIPVFILFFLALLWIPEQFSWYGGHRQGARSTHSPVGWVSCSGYDGHDQCGRGLCRSDIHRFDLSVQ